MFLCVWRERGGPLVCRRLRLLSVAAWHQVRYGSAAFEERSASAHKALYHLEVGRAEQHADAGKPLLHSAIPLHGSGCFRVRRCVFALCQLCLRAQRI